jgi:hypothetical protein
MKAVGETRIHEVDFCSKVASCADSILAVDRHVSASTQNQALAAVLFLYQAVLGCDSGVAG